MRGQTFKAATEDIRAGTWAFQPIPSLRSQPAWESLAICLHGVNHPARGNAAAKPAKPKTAFQDYSPRASKSQDSAMCDREASSRGGS